LGEHACRFGSHQQETIVKEKFGSHHLGQRRHPELVRRTKNIDHVTERERPGQNPERISISPHTPVRDQSARRTTAELGGPGEEDVKTLTLSFRADQEPG